ncbi:MAG: hypothetical protein KAH54_12290 [Candidatus Sabulitectum sp.]|nr:hypothetical protein [Candidatus Sabulitectum sp.]
MLILGLVTLTVFAGQIAVNLDPVPGNDADWLVYDDGTAAWITWAGTYRGVWFNIEDFAPGAGTAFIEESEFWFYHPTGMYSWTISDVYLEVWNGDAEAPVTRLDQTMATAVHYAPVFVEYSPSLEAEGNFWGITNTEMDDGGWPSNLGDGTPGTHSFFTDDFIVWEPWGEYGDLFVRIAVTSLSLDNATWGSLKATFQ